MRRRWIYVNGEAIEVAADYVTPARVTHSDGALWGDRAYDEMNDPRFRTRTQHREYMKRNNLTTVDDFRKQWDMDAVERDARLRGVDASRKDDIADAITKLQAGYKPRIERMRDDEG